VDHVPSNAQLRADLAQGPAFGVQLCRAINVHSATLNELRQSSGSQVGAAINDADRGRREDADHDECDC
jgi:hypothetical protein